MGFDWEGFAGGLLEGGAAGFSGGMRPGIGGYLEAVTNPGAVQKRGIFSSMLEELEPYRQEIEQLAEQGDIAGAMVRKVQVLGEMGRRGIDQDVLSYWNKSVAEPMLQGWQWKRAQEAASQINLQDPASVYQGAQGVIQAGDIGTGLQLAGHAQAGERIDATKARYNALATRQQQQDQIQAEERRLRQEHRDWQRGRAETQDVQRQTQGQQFIRTIDPATGQEVHQVVNPRQMEPGTSIPAVPRAAESSTQRTEKQTIERLYKRLEKEAVQTAPQDSDRLTPLRQRASALITEYNKKYGATFQEPYLTPTEYGDKLRVTVIPPRSPSIGSLVPTGTPTPTPNRRKLRYNPETDRVEEMP